MVSIECTTSWIEFCVTSNGLIFDHTPMILSVFAERWRGRAPFKHYKMWSLTTNFDNRVKECWEHRVNETLIFSVVQHIKKVKDTLKVINKEGYSNVHIADARAFSKMMECQTQAHHDRS